MANFKTHLVGGFAVSGVLGLAIYKAELVNAYEFIICVLLGTVGGLLPDIDSDNSTPIKIGFDVLSLMSAFALTIYWRSSLSLSLLLILWVVGYLTVRYGVLTVFTRMTTHRGMIHSVPYMMVIALGVTCISYFVLDTASISSWFYGAFLLLGALIHLSLDEIYSVDLLGQRLKRSSGTAMKFYKDSQRLYYIVLYGILFTLIFIAPPFVPFWQKVTDPITWWLLKDSLLTIS